jgi:hypothetical protein
MGMITGNFSLADWAKAKAISFAVSLLTAGMSTLCAVKTVVGTLSKA